MRASQTGGATLRLLHWITTSLVVYYYSRQRCAITPMFPVKVISLERSVERRAEFRHHNSHLDYEFFNAVDGLALAPETIAGCGLFQAGLPYQTGAYGAALSHYSLWREAIRTGRPLTVAEDDAIFRLDFAQTHAALLSGLAPDWDIVLWGWNLDSI